MANFGLRSAGNGQKVQAGVGLEIGAAIALDSSTSTLYTTDSDAIQTTFGCTSDFQVATDSAHTNIFTARTFTVEGADVALYLRSAAGSISVEVAINKGVNE